MNQLKEKRLEKGLTQTELSEITNVSREYISNLENGKNNPSYQTARIIAEALGYTTDEVFGKKKGRKRCGEQ